MAKFGLDNSIPALVQEMFVTLLFSMLSNLLLKHLFSRQIFAVNPYRLTVGTCQLSVPLRVAAALERRIKKMFVIAYSITAPNVLLVYV
jgi:hypothetical protein